MELTGLRILIVEDMLLVAEVISEILQGEGCIIVGPAPRVQRALALVEAEKLDGAALDVNLAGEYSFPVAARLKARGVPFIFLTGYDDAGLLPPEYRAVPRLAKPFRNGDLIGMIGSVCKVSGRGQMTKPSAPV
jgi:CheY-like chemotaxis protein